MIGCLLFFSLRSSANFANEFLMRIQFSKNCESYKIYLFSVKLSEINPTSKVTCICCARLEAFSIYTISESAIEKQQTKNREGK